MIFSTAIRTPPPDLSGYARTFETVMDLVVGVNTLVHNMNFSSQDAFTNSVFVGGSAVQLDINSVDVNTITLTTLVAATDAQITLIGI
jgi:hypothetical protein